MEFQEGARIVEANYDKRSTLIVDVADPSDLNYV